jgi:uncharacterized phiE125 gp8 family phage protein
VIKLITPPISEPITLQEAKDYLRVDFNNDDALISTLITAARQFIEKLTRRSIAVATWEMSLDEFPQGEIIIPLPPLKTINSISYIKDGTPQTFNDYEVDDYSQPARIKGEWPETDNVLNAVKINFDAGYDTVPEPLKQAILLLISHWYENREPVTTNGSPANIPFTIDALVSQYKIWRF